MQKYMKRDILALIDSTKKVVSEALDYLINFEKNKKINFKRDKKFHKEIKSNIDEELNNIIYNGLKNTNISILSEEAEYKDDITTKEYCFIVDPLDGTVNYIRGISESSISIALYMHGKPVFGVLGIFPSKKIIWGGKLYGSFLNDKIIEVSDIEKKSDAIICSGFPSRLHDKEYNFINTFKQFLKVRMLGSASISLFNVAKGSVEVYYEKDIMIWDVAAGIAIVEGAGGNIKLSNGNYQNSLNVIATNGKIAF